VTAILKREASAEEVNGALKSAAEGAAKGLSVEYSTDPLVSKTSWATRTRRLSTAR
jgi:glyceraldehyde 3-phosphate dehydrogenase